jgi:hypothetical protein
MEKMEITFKDRPRDHLKDGTFGNKSALPGVKGRVRIHERKLDGSDKKLYLVEDTSNLITYRGRAWLAQRALNLDLGEDPEAGTGAVRPDWKDWYISWIAFGTGGAASVTPLNPIAVDPSSYTLNTHGTCSGSPGSFFTDGNSREYHKFETDTPTFHSDTEIDTDDYANMENVTYEDILLDPADRKRDSFIIIRCQARLGAAEGNSTGYQDINEAGLYISSSKDVNSPPADDEIELFAKVSFATIRKDASRELLFSWYVYF